MFKLLFRHTFFLLLTFCLPLFSLSGQYFLEWEQNYDSPDVFTAFDQVQDIFPTSDGGYLASGIATNLGAWVFKIDANGNMLWEELYDNNSGSLTSQGNNDDYLIAGFSNTSNSYINLKKIDEEGSLLWEQNLFEDIGYGFLDMNALTADQNGGYFVGGGYHEYYEGYLWLTHLDEDGNTLWNYLLDDAIARDVIATPDGGCMVVGGTGQYSSFFESADVLLLKLDADGNLEWQQTYGDGPPNWDEGTGTDYEIGLDIIETNEGDYLISGQESDSWNGTGMVMKVDSNGELIWQQSYDLPDFKEIKEDSEGEIFVIGDYYSESYDFWMAQLDSEGNIISENTFGGSENDYAYTFCFAHDEGLILAGKTESNDGDVNYTSTEEDHFAWIIKLREIENTITAHTFHDENENGILDEGELPLFNQNLGLNPDALGSYSNGEGNTNFYVDAGTYTVVYEDTNPLWLVSNDASELEVVFPVDSMESDTTIYFPLIPAGDFTSNAVDIASSITRCNQATNVWLTYSNTGTVVTDGVVSLTLDSLTTLGYSYPPVDSVAGNQLFWFYEDFHPTYSEQIQLTVEMPGVEDLGAEINFEAETQSMEGQAYDKAIYASELICAYDPNDKLVTPIGVGAEAYTLFEDTLNYTIRFQNTGNDTAFNVVILDTLSEHLDLSTFRPISSSHDVETTIDWETRIIEFAFNDIYLADSFVNEPDSHGFIKFEVKASNGITENTLVENNAGIYFDFNPPIVTNTVHNTFVSEIPGGFDLSMKLFLEGPYENDGTMTTNLTEILPLNQPYNLAPWNYNGTENITTVPSNMVDWVLVEARTGSPNLTGQLGTTVVEQKVGLLLSDGSIVGVDGNAPLRFVDLEDGLNYYFSVRHRNHLDVLTANSITTAPSMNYDFTTSIDQAFGPAQQKLASDGTPVLYAGDMMPDGTIQVSDYDVWFGNGAILNTYHPADLTMDKVVQVTDYDAWFFNKAKIGVLELQY